MGCEDRRRRRDVDFICECREVRSGRDRGRGCGCDRDRRDRCDRGRRDDFRCRCFECNRGRRNFWW